jgi:hypothetical protein
MNGPVPIDRGRAFWPRRIRTLVAGMTLEQKAEQISATVLPAADEITDEQPGAGIAFVPVSAPDAAERVAAFERSVRRRAPAGGPAPIPVLPIALGSEMPRRFLPRLGRLASWDLRLTERLAASTARSLRSSGLYGHLVPTGSGSEPGDGADPLLAAMFQTARVHGAQGRSAGRSNPIGPGHIAVVMPLGVYPDGQWHERTLRTSLLTAAEAAVRAGAAIVVPSPAGNAGVPTHTDGWLLREVLRQEWRFTGIVVAHPGAVDALDSGYRIAADPDEAIALALEAGVDVISTPDASRRLAALVGRGAVPTWLVDDAVAAVLACKLRLGLLGDPDSPPPEPSLPGAGRGEHLAGSPLARQALTRALVLLSDPTGVLPLDPHGTVDVVPGVGGSPDVTPLAAALAAALPRALVRAGPAVASADPAGTVVIVTSRPEDAVLRAEAAITSRRRCAVLVTSDRVHSLGALAATTATVLVCWRPLGGHAGTVADVLTGRAEPGGRLPLALSRDPVDGRPAAVTFPLGHGGGYTSFAYSRLVISPAVLDGGDVVRVQCWITNTGTRHGREVVQAYLANPTGRSVVMPGPSLAAFSTVEVAAGQTLPVTVRLPLDRLAVWNRSMQQILEPGTIDVLVGRSAGDIRLRGTVRIAARPSRWRPGLP